MLSVGEVATVAELTTRVTVLLAVMVWAQVPASNFVIVKTIGATAEPIEVSNVPAPEASEVTSAVLVAPPFIL